MRMSQNLILLPVLAQVLLTLLLLVRLPVVRSRSMRENRQRLEDMALAAPTDWNRAAQKVANSYASQFELPVLFYVVSLAALVTRMVDLPMLGLAALFVLSRLAHAAIHIGPNVVAWRFPVFGAGLLVLIAMSGLLAFRILSAGL